MKSILALISILIGMDALIRGKILFIKEYHGVKNVPLHSRIEGGAVTIVGILILLTNWILINYVLLMVIILIIVVIVFILEIIFKAI